LILIPLYLGKGGKIPISLPDEGEMNSDVDGSSASGDYEKLKKFFQIAEY
jgi:hypothetical protein